MVSAEQLGRLKAVAPMAQASAQRWGVPASITLAQWIYESTWGTSELAVKANNFFGVKATDHAAKDSYIELPTHEVLKDGRTIVELAHFASYATAQAAFDAHGALLSKSPRYAPAMACRNASCFATQLQRCGYSTNPHYADLLTQAIRLYRLDAYDAPTSPTTTAPQEGA